MNLIVDNVWSGYGKITILQGISLQIGEGEIIAVLGPNGVGKTTLMKTLAGSLPTKQGDIFLNEENITSFASHIRAKKGIGYVPQGRGIFPQLTVKENLLVGAHAFGLPERYVHDTLEEFPALKEKLSALGGSLSGGQQQQLALARALVTRPQLLLLDEPSEGIQPSILEDIAEALMHIKNSRNLSVLIVEQNLDFAISMSDRAYLMEVGAISREVSKEMLAAELELQGGFLGTS